MSSTYPLVPHKTPETSLEAKTTILEYENGVEQRIDHNTEVRGTFTIEHFQIDKIKRDILEAFYKEHKDVKKFYFVNYDSGETHEVRFLDKKLAFNRVGVERYNVTVRLKECH